MLFEHWLAFAAASAVLVTIPGPTVLLVISYSLAHGARLTPAIIAGVTLGDVTAMTASMAGLGVILLDSATIFTVLKWIGTVYLIYLGIKLWRAPVFTTESCGAHSVAPRRAFAHAYAVTALSPKSILFFVAFVPQFLVGTEPLLPQMVALEVTFLVLATASTTLYAAAASTAQAAVPRPGVQRLVNRTGGSLLIGAGLLALSLRRGPA
ncbi:MAG: LysE family translocator [Rhodospirillales bacterium]|nr:LysE family translocator [Rhodospirillales bacterium]